MIEFDIIGELEESSGIDVLISIGESYVKELEIMCNNGFNERYIQESCVFMESDNTDGNNSNNKQSVGSYIKNLFTKVFNYIKSVFNKILNIIKNKFTKNQRYIAASANVFAIADRIINMSSNYSEEYYDDSIDDYLYQEGLFKTDEEKFANAVVKETKKTIKKNEKQQQLKQKEAQKTREQAIRDIEKALKKQFSNEIYTRLLSTSEINNIAHKVSVMVSPEELRKLQTELRKMQSSSDMRNISEETKKNFALIERLKEADVNNNKEIQNMYQQLTIAQKSAVHGKTDTEMRVKLVEDFANTMGKTLNKLSKTEHLSADNLKNAIYGNGSIFSTVASYFAAIFKRIPEAIKNAKHLSEDAAKFGKELYDSHIDFDDAVFEDERKRQEYGLRMNNVARTALFALDQVKEESYGWADDEWFNKQSYGKNNIITSYLGGPVTCLIKILNCLFVGPVALGVGVSDIISYVLFRKVAKTFNPEGYHKDSKRSIAKATENETTINAM